jgi:hypothetical protein
MTLLNVTEHLHAFMRQLFGAKGERGITGVAPVGRWRDHERLLVNANALGRHC